MLLNLKKIVRGACSAVKTHCSTVVIGITNKDLDKNEGMK